MSKKNRNSYAKKTKAARKSVQNFLDENRDVEDALMQAARNIARGDYGSWVRFDEDVVDELLEDFGFSDLPFTASELLRYW